MDHPMETRPEVCLRLVAGFVRGAIVNTLRAYATFLNGREVSESDRTGRGETYLISMHQTEESVLTRKRPWYYAGGNGPGLV